MKQRIRNHSLSALLLVTLTSTLTAHAEDLKAKAAIGI
jgi:hypothetical protein